MISFDKKKKKNRNDPPGLTSVSAVPFQWLVGTVGISQPASVSQRWLSPGPKQNSRVKRKSFLTFWGWGGVAFHPPHRPSWKPIVFRMAHPPSSLSKLFSVSRQTEWWTISHIASVHSALALVSAWTPATPLNARCVWESLQDLANCYSISSYRCPN